MMAKTKPQDVNSITLPADPELRRQVEELLARDRRQSQLEKSPEISGFPRHVFDRHGPAARQPGETVMVCNVFEKLGGTIVEKLTDVAYVVRVMDVDVVVHEPDEAWIPREV